MNRSIAVPGLLQSNQRAELLAVLCACLRDPRPLDIRSDSEYVCAGCSSWRAWIQTGWKGEHSDLWHSLAEELQRRASTVKVSWVKGHAKRIDIERGRTTELDKWGNDGADALAVRAAQTHRVPEEFLISASLRKHSAKNVQQMMITVLKARLAAERATVSEACDRGSNFGDADDFDVAHVDDAPLFASPLSDEFDLGAALYAA